MSKGFWGSVRKEKLFERESVAERLVQVVKETGVEGRCWDWEGEEVPRERGQEKEWDLVGGRSVFLSLGNCKCS